MGFFNYAVETMPLKQLRQWQNDRLRHQLHILYASVPYYQRTWDEAGIRLQDIRTISDLPKLPFTHKSALRDNYPFGLFTLPVSGISRLHCSSGTTGKPTVVGYSAQDLVIFAEVVARSLAAGGCTPGMTLQNAYGYGLFTGGLGLHYGAEKLGMTVIPVSGGNTERQLMLLEDFKSEVLCCTPSYALTIAEEIVKRGWEPTRFNLKYAILGAEPWTEHVRVNVEKDLDVQATNIYGLSEIIGPGVSQEDVEEKGSGSYIWEDHFYPEVVDKDSGEPLPEGQAGVLVLTTLTKEAMPLIRYWTGDITRIYYDKGGKRTFIKMAPIMGRADDMLIIRGVNLFHTQVEAVLSHFPACSANYQLIIIKEGYHDKVSVRVEASHSAEGLAQSLEGRLKSETGLTMAVELCSPGSIPRSEGGKLNRIVDLRNK
jgi:phenylacetate-CoA ligase